jgi:hypothetical protein
MLDTHELHTNCRGVDRKVQSELVSVPGPRDETLYTGVNPRLAETFAKAFG